MKTNTKGFFNLNPHHNGGFTLVELIVVIAILAILAGVAVPAYSGYITKANMQADIALASDVAQALLLRYYSNPQQAMTTSVVLSENGATIAEGDTFAADAMQEAFGTGWQQTAKLKYNKWGNGAAVAQEVIKIFERNTNSALDPIFNGSTKISYTDNIPELFELMENTACDIAGKRESLGSGAGMVTNAAGLTVTDKSATDFSDRWASGTWDSTWLMDGVGSYDGNAGNAEKTDAQLNNAIANAAVLKARNVALATYLKDQGYGEVYDIIADCTYSGSSVPNDAAGMIMQELNEEGDPNNEERQALMSQILGVVPEAEMDGLGETIRAYYNTDNGPSQAYNDGLAYFAMMSTVNELKNSTNLDTTNDETWWNDLSSAINMYGSIANGTVNLDELHDLYSKMGSVSDNTVVAMLIVENGVPTVVISPVGAES